MKKYLVPTILISLWIITSIAVWYLKENKLLTIIEGQKVYDLTDTVWVYDLDSSKIKIVAGDYDLHLSSIQERQQQLRQVQQNINQLHKTKIEQLSRLQTLNKKEILLNNKLIKNNTKAIQLITLHNKKVTVEIEKSTKENRANTFSNIGFILNPNYAKKHKIDPEIVARHNKKCHDYIKRYTAVAIVEMKKFNIPASITLAQGLLESNAGDSRLAKCNNNHFGIKCFSKQCEEGHCVNYTDDSHKDFFRHYQNAWESYRAHSLFLHRSRYKHLTQYTDYKKWAKGLSKAGYATDKKYSDKLIRLIEVLKLYELDG